MRILVSAYACSPNQGSEAACGWNWSYHLALQGHEVWCLTRKTNEKSIRAWISRRPLKNLHFVFVKTSRGLAYLRSKYHYPTEYLQYVIWQYYAYREARFLHTNTMFELVHHVSYGSLQLGSHLWKLKIPFVFGPVGGAQKVPIPLKPYLRKGRYKEYIRTLVSNVLLYRLAHTQQTIKNAKLILAYNQDTYRLAKKMGAPKVRLMLDGAVASTAIPATFPKRPVRKTMQVLWVGRLIPEKGLSLLINVFERLGDEYPIHLNVVGSGRLRAYYQRRVQQLQLTDRIRFHGKLPYHALEKHYLASDVFMYCGLRNTLGIQVLEAMSYGMPVVTLNLHGIKIFIPKDTGMHVSLTTATQIIEELKQALINLYLNTDRREELGRNAYAYAKTQTWSNKVTQATKEYYPTI